MRKIFVGMAGGSAERCRMAMADAAAKASWPGQITFGVCPWNAVSPEGLFKAAMPAACRVMMGEGLSGYEAWRTVYGLYDGQDYALQVTPEAFFLEGWDRNLIGALGSCGREAPLITCFPATDGIPRAVAVRGFTDDGGLIMAPGLKVMNTPQPVKACFLSPGFVFGEGEWMRMAGENAWDGSGALSLSLCGFAAGFTAYTMHLPSVGRAEPASIQPERLPEGGFSTVLPFFEDTAGICFEKREAGPYSYLGVYTENGRYPVQVPLAEGVRHQLRRRKEGSVARVMLATASGKHSPRLPLPVRLTLFENLAELARLSLCCYCPPDQAARLKQILPNTYARREDEFLSYNTEEEFLRSKPYFIAQAALQFPAHTHYGWIDMDYVKHPLYPPAVFVWDELADERIHLALVNGKVDTSLIVVPRQKIDWLLDTTSILHAAPERGGGDQGLFQCLADTYPDMFTLHPMAKKHMLLTVCQPLLSGGTLDDA